MFSRFPVEYQMDSQDCGRASLKIIAKHFGKFYSLQYLRDRCGITKEGISLLDLSTGAESIGLHTLAIECSVDDVVNSIPFPAIIFWNNNHFVVVYGADKKHIWVSDPSKGRIKYTHEQFRKGWYRKDEKQGILLAIEPTADFKDSKAQKEQRKNSFSSILKYFLPYKNNFALVFIIMMVVTLLQGVLPLISKAVIDVGIKTSDVNFINMALIGNISILLSVMISTQFIIGMLNGPLIRFINFIVSGQYAKISFLRINEIRQLEDEDELLTIGTNTTVIPNDKSITLSNVNFQYTINSPLVLRNVFLSIPENKTTAIVGGSGSGKSTLLKLLVRLYKPSYGEIKMGGHHVIIDVYRYGYGSDSTTSTFTVNVLGTCGQTEPYYPTLSGYMLEPRVDSYFVTTAGSDTAILPGKYTVFQRSDGKWELQGVEGRSWIQIHIGNTAENTEGCFLPGYGVGYANGDYSVSESTAMFNELSRIMSKYGDLITIVVH